MIEHIALRAMTATDIPAVRQLHARSFTELAREHHSDIEIAAHVALIFSPGYADELAGANISVAIDQTGCIVATAGWQAMADRAVTARIRKVFVDPGMARRGLGRRMVEDAEMRARQFGFADFYVRANINAVPLYRVLGYREIEAGVMMVRCGVTLPVVYMEKTRVMAPRLSDGA
jgi:GNAT superfamily N-acetyltransferase